MKRRDRGTSTPYCSKLPRKTTGRCQALSSEGDRCRRRAAIEWSVHLDGELYDKLRWVVVRLCGDHAPG